MIQMYLYHTKPYWRNLYHSMYQNQRGFKRKNNPEVETKPSWCKVYNVFMDVKEVEIVQEIFLNILLLR